MRKHSSVVLQKLLIFDVWKSQSSVRATSCLWFLPFLQTVTSLLTCSMNKTLTFRWSFRPIAAAESSGSPETQQNYKATACSWFVSLSVWVYCSFFFLFFFYCFTISAKNYNRSLQYSCCSCWNSWSFLRRHVQFMIPLIQKTSWVCFGADEDLFTAACFLVNALFWAGSCLSKLFL